jgi:hypothetical protein
MAFAKPGMFFPHQLPIVKEKLVLLVLQDQINKTKCPSHPHLKDGMQFITNREFLED